LPLKDGTPEDYEGAAIRHYQDAESLHQARRLDNAGHLIGFAAECAIKHKIGTLDSLEHSPNLHLPHLLSAARKRLGERNGYRSMFDLVKAEIFKGWDVDWRYAPTGKTTQGNIDEWFSVTKRLLAAASIKVRLP
jgi:hypothetical protein